jgi:hypothetical protein
MKKLATFGGFNESIRTAPNPPDIIYNAFGVDVHGRNLQKNTFGVYLKHGTEMRGMRCGGEAAYLLLEEVQRPFS